MIPTLYAKTETDFTHNGIGFLVDAVKCTVNEERNGSYELSLQYPITGKWYDQITDGAIVKAKANETSNLQLFRIYKSSKPLKGIVTYSAEHISYDLNGIPSLGLSVKNVTPQTAMTRAFANAALPCPFTALSDIATLNSTNILTPCGLRSILGGQRGSVLDVWGGEFEFDNFTVKLHSHRGKNNGVTIEYGKNLKDLKQESNITDCYTHLCPYAVYKTQDENGDSQEEYVYLSEKVIPLPAAAVIGHSKAYIMDFSDRFGEGEEITEEKLRAKATAYAAASNLGAPKINITVSFIQLWQTEEYQNIAPLERVKMCDTVTVRFSKLGVTASAKIVKTSYNSLEEKYESVTLGDAKSSFADTVNKQSADISNLAQSVIKGQAQAAEELKKAIANATSLITGHSGGYVVLNPAEKPHEILILDAPTIEEAVNVWRWNGGGLGHSSTGYNGDFSTAITADGSIVADFITAGILNGALLKADSVESTAISQHYKTEVINKIAESASTMEQKFKAADGELLSSISETFKNYSTTEQTNSAIAQTSNSIMTEVNKKVNNADFGTKITQNYSSVRIAWNNISKYIEFSDGALNIYKSTTQGHENLLMQMKYNGAWYYHDGATIGKIGTNSWSGDDSYKGLVFDLESDASYMCWAYRENENDGVYNVKLIYHSQNGKDKAGLHFACDTYCNGNLYLNNYVKAVEFNDSGAGLYSESGKDITLKSRNTIFECTDGKVICGGELDMRGYSILNQSDARYKTNITPSKVNALSLISQIETKSYDWIENGDHCDVGVIAQQIQNIIPELVHEDTKTGSLAIKTDKFIPYLIKAIQELEQNNSNRTKAISSLYAAGNNSINEKWVDTYSESDKNDFIARNCAQNQNIVCEPKRVLIPIDRNGEEYEK